MQLLKLADGRLIGVDIFEIEAFSKVKNEILDAEVLKLSENLSRIFSEVYHIANKDTSLELLWINVNGEIKLYLVFRAISNSEQELRTLFSILTHNFLSFLFNSGYEVKNINKEEINQILGEVGNQSIFSVVKSERTAISSTSPYPYYFTDIIPSLSQDNLINILSSLKKYPGTALSLSLIPEYISDQEALILNELGSELTKISEGFYNGNQMFHDPLAKDPHEFIEYFRSRIGLPLFSYSISIFGSRAACADITTKMISLLNSGTKKVVSNSNFTCLDLTNEKISLLRDFAIYPYNLKQALIYTYRNQNLFEKLPISYSLMRFPYLVTPEEASVFFKPPIYEEGMPLRPITFRNSLEKVDTKLTQGEGIKIGNIIGSTDTIFLPENNFTKHALIVGTPGSGKTTFSVDLLTQFTDKGIPFLAIEPTKTEYRGMIDAIPNLKVFTPGKNSVSPFIINPFIPPKGITVETYIPSLVTAFKAAFEMPSPLDMLFLKSVRAAYNKYGWRDYSKYGDPDVEIFGMHEFILVFKEELANMNYSKEVKGNMESAGLLRLQNLVEQNSNIFDSINTVPVEDLLSGPIVLELNAIENQEQKALVMALILMQITLYTKHNFVGDGKLKNALLMDEAHVLLESNTEAQAQTVKAIQNMIAEIRSYGTSVIIADQVPSKVSNEVVANTDIKVAFRLVQGTEKALIADAINMSDEARDTLSNLRPGEAFLFSGSLNSARLVKTEDIRDKVGIRLSVPDEEISEKNTYWDDKEELLKPYSYCSYSPYCKKTCKFKTRSDAEYIASYIYSKYRKQLNNMENIKKIIFHLPKIASKEGFKLEEPSLIACTRIKLFRKLEMLYPINLSKKEKLSLFYSGLDQKENKNV